MAKRNNALSAAMGFKPIDLADAAYQFAAAEDAHEMTTRQMAAWFLGHVVGFPVQDKMREEDIETIKVNFRRRKLDLSGKNGVSINRETGAIVESLDTKKYPIDKWAAITLVMANSFTTHEYGELNAKKTNYTNALKTQVGEYRVEMSKYISTRFNRLLKYGEEEKTGGSNTRSSNKSFSEKMDIQKETTIKAAKTARKRGDTTVWSDEGIAEYAALVNRLNGKAA